MQRVILSGENLKAAEQYEEIRKLESNVEELEEIYEKLQLIYDEAQEYKKVGRLCRGCGLSITGFRKDVAELSGTLLWKSGNGKRIMCRSSKKAMQAVPDLTESEAFKQLQEKYKIVIDGENIRVGE